MKRKRVVARGRAERDIDEALTYYLNEAGAQVALAFIESLEAAVDHLARYPASGSPRFGVELNLPGLRSWPLDGFPYLIFYVELDTYVDVWRVLHGERDIPAWMSESV